MDTTETYRKMCEKAVEIQAIADKFNKATWAYQFSGEVMLAEGGNYWFRNVWLPRQDQLQEMIGGFEASLNLLEKYRLYYLDEATETRMDFWFAHNITSMEQLWLAFVVREKYGKIWDGDDWVIKKRIK